MSAGAQDRVLPDPGAGDPALRDLSLNQAAALGTDVLVLVAGGVPAGSRDLDGARSRVVDALGELAPYAGANGVRLAVEPLHPMFCSDRCVVSTLAQALDIAERFPADQVGVVVDAYHVWWDPSVYQAVARAGERILSWQVCDWVTAVTGEPPRPVLATPVFDVCAQAPNA